MKQVCDGIVQELRGLARPQALESMARFGVDPASALGVSVPEIRLIARRYRNNQPLAEALWATGIHEARTLASLVADPKVIAASTMNRWVADFASWDVCDACCCNLFDRTPFVWKVIPEWAADDREYVRRAAFSTLAGAAVHDKAADDQVFLSGLALIEKYAFDERNFVRKSVNWALRNIGKRKVGHARLLPAAVECAKRLRQQDSKSARWIAADALREFRLKFEC